MQTIHSLIVTTAAIAAFATTLTGAQAPVNLGTAGDFAILSKSAISTTGVTDITGDVGVSPAAATFITGFTLSLDASNEFSTSPLVTGKIYAADYAPPTPVKMTTVIGDMEIAYTDAAGRTSGNAIKELGAGEISGMTLEPGLYQWGTGLLVNSDITLEGCPKDVWIFQIAQTLTVGSGAKVHLSGGAQAANVFWQVAGDSVTLGSTAEFAGVILAKELIVLKTGAMINGRLLAQTGVSLDANTVTLPSPASSIEERLLTADSISRNGAGEVSLVFTVTPGHSLTLQDSTDLVNWRTLSTTVPAASPHVITEATSVDDARRFYRAFYQGCE